VPKRTYADSCGIARSLDLIGDRWTLLVVRELLLGPKRYTDLQEALRRIAPDVLAQRLRDLEAGGLAERAAFTGPGRAKVYRLTERGRELQPVLVALGRFGSRLPLPDPPQELTPDAMAVALLTVFRPEWATGISLEVELVLGPESFTATLHDGRLGIARRPGVDHRASIETSPGVLTGVLWHGVDVEAAESEGDLQLRGDRDAALAFLAVFRTQLA